MRHLYVFAIGIMMLVSACVGTTTVRMNHGAKNAMTDGCASAVQFNSWYDGVPPVFTTPAGQFREVAAGIRDCEMGRADAAYVASLRAAADYYVQEANAAVGTTAQRLEKIERHIGKTDLGLACHDEIIRYGMGGEACAELERQYAKRFGDANAEPVAEEEEGE